MEIGSALTQTLQPATTSRPHVLVVGPGIFSAYDLPNSGEMLVGRRPTADVWIDDPLLSQEHLKVVIAEGYFVEDLGSRNGTFVRQERLAAGSRRRLEPGEAITLGSCLLIVQAAPPASAIRRAVSYGFLRLRLDEELARAAYEPSRRFCLARIQVVSPNPQQAFEEVASRVLRPFDLLTAFAPDEYAALFSATAASDARTIVAELSMSLAARGLNARTALSRYPEDGRTAATLEAHGIRLLKPRAEPSDIAPELIAESPAMRSLYEQAERIAKSQISVLISGETGVGKDVLARWLHRRSSRESAPFQAINCAALPENLLEDQLFGHERGAFTGATRPQKGLIEAAQGGTVFLDEIAEVPLALQAKLLRLLECGEVQVLGAPHPRKVDVRFLAATNVDLAREVAQKRFRADLFYRLKGVELRVPPLRERSEDLRALVHALLTRSAALEGLTSIPELSPSAFAALRDCRFPGNVRELANLLHRALVLSDGKLITDDELLFENYVDADIEDTASEPSPSRPPSAPHEKGRRVSNPSRRQVIDALAAAAGNQSRAAEALGIPRKRLRHLIQSYELPTPRDRQQ